MDFKTTSTNRRRRKDAGFTLVEFMVAMGIGSILMIGLASFSAFSNRSFVSMSNYIDLDQKSRKTLDQMTREIRQTRRLTSFAANRLVFEKSDGSILEYVYSSADRTLTENNAGATEVLLTECDSLTFSIYQRNPVGGSYDQYPTADPSTCKLVNIHWVCSRKIKGNIANTESVQTAKVVIRKQ